MRHSDRLSINLATVRQQWDMRQAVEGCLRHGITRHRPLARPDREDRPRRGAPRSSRTTASASPACAAAACSRPPTRERRQAAIDDNRRAIDEAAALRADCLVLVVGGLPEGSKDIAAARDMVAEGIAAVLPHARACGVPLAIEPLHPMYAADRACVNTLKQALDICDALGGDGIGVAIDVYHVWWDPELPRADRPRRGRQAASWRTISATGWCRPRDLLLDRGMMGDGVIDHRRIRAAFEAAGFHGPQEVEIFSRDDWWQRDGDEVLATCLERYETLCRA